MKILETYARSLLEAGKTEGRVFQDLKQLEALASMTPELLEVLKALVERDQLDLLPRIAELYRTMTEEDDDIVGLTVTTAVPLDDELRAQIKERFEKDFGKKVFLIENVDPSISAVSCSRRADSAAISRSRRSCARRATRSLPYT